jgi:site-specific DNA recombinase
MGPTYTKRRGKFYRYYLCVHASKNGNDSCPVRTLSAGEIETAVVDRLRDILRSPEMVAAAARSAQEQMAQHVNQLSRRRRDVELTLQALREEAGRLTAAEASLPVSTRLDELRGLIEEQEQALQSLGQETEAAERAAFSEQEAIEVLSAVEAVWEHLFPDQQERIVRLLVDRVEVGPRGAEVHVRADGLHSLVDELRDTTTAGIQEPS